MSQDGITTTDAIGSANVNTRDNIPLADASASADTNIEFNTQDTDNAPVEEENFDVSLSKLGSFILKASINLLLPFINGMMMGFGEIFAHELCFRHQWQFARVQPPRRMINNVAVHNSSAPQSGEKRGSVLLQN